VGGDADPRPTAQARRVTVLLSDIYDAANQLTEIKFGGFDPQTAPSPIACFDMNSGNQAGVDKQDGAVTMSDVLKFRPVFGSVWPDSRFDPFYDLNGDQRINFSDILQFSAVSHGVEFGKTCPRYYKYNADGLRLSSTLGKFVTSYTWNPVSSQILQEVAKQDTTGVIISKNTYVYGAAGLVSTTDMNGNQKYIFPDGLGSVTATVNSSDQSLASNYDYEAFGKPTSGSPSDTFLFAGQQYDPIARAQAGGLYYLRARYYDPSTGTFLSRDPLLLQLSPDAVGPGHMPAVMNPQPPSTDESAPRPGTPVAVTNPLTLNPYAYGVNNPANQTDPSGRCSSGLWSFCSISMNSIDFRPVATGGLPTILTAEN
jgi:RHS repeat-associated protein